MDGFPLLFCFIQLGTFFVTEVLPGSPCTYSLVPAAVTYVVRALAHAQSVAVLVYAECEVISIPQLPKLTVRACAGTTVPATKTIAAAKTA